MVNVTAAVSIGLLGSSAYFVPWSQWSWRLGRLTAIRNEIAESRILALTYDDGPSQNVTPRLLDLLRQDSAVATFFMLGQNAKRYPHIVERVVKEGHDIGCHSYRHLNAWKVTPSRAVADINAGYDSLSSWLGPSGMFRPPYGKMTLPTYWLIRHRAASVWWWTIDSGDTQKVVPNKEKLLETVRRQNGGIILMHDLERTKERDSFVLDATAALLKLAAQESLSIVTLTQLCH